MTYWKIGPQCVLGVLCLVLFLSVGMLFSNIRIWELNCYKCDGRQVITIFKGKMYGRILFTLSSSLIKAYNWRLWCKKGTHGQFHIMDITFRGQIFGNETFSYILLFKTWRSIHHMVLTISRKKIWFHSQKLSNIFVLNSVMDSTKLESADSGGWINDIK